MGKRINECIWTIDFYLLLGMKKVIDFCVGWFSWRQLWIERVLIGVFAVLLTGGSVLRGFGYWDHLFNVWTVWCVIEMHRTPDSVRRLERLLAVNSVRRVLCSVLLLFVFLLDVLPPRLPGDYCWAAANALIALLLFMVAIPTSDDPGGRRRRRVEAIKEALSRPWLPAFGGAS